MNRLLRLRSRSRGQTLILGVVSMIILVGMLMMSFSISNAIHEKIRLQNKADSYAYSMAVVTARTMNTLGHYNRALAATYAAQMSMHAFLSVATLQANLILGAAAATAMAAGLECAMCNPFGTFDPVCCFYHCTTATIMAGVTAVNYIFWAFRYPGLDNRFNRAVAAIQRAGSNIKTLQNVIYLAGNTTLVLGGWRGQINNNNGAGNQAVAVDAMNAHNFACAFEGGPLDSVCTRDGRNYTNIHNQVMKDAGNALRTQLHAGVTGTLITNTDNWTLVNPDAIRDWMLPPVGNRFIVSAWMDHNAIGENSPWIGGQWWMGSGSRANVAGGGATGIITVIPHDRPGVSPVNAYAHSNRNGFFNSHGEMFLNFVWHLIMGQDHNRFGGHGAGNPCSTNNNRICFIHFRGRQNPSTGNQNTEEFGQPTFFGAMSQNTLGRVSGTGNAGTTANIPWEVTSTGRIRNPNGMAGASELRLRPQGTAYAQAKGMAYFHQLGNWRVQPNLFDPFWKAKLEYFRSNIAVSPEFALVAGLNGDTDGAAMSRFVEGN